MVYQTHIMLLHVLDENELLRTINVELDQRVEWRTIRPGVGSTQPNGGSAGRDVRDHRGATGSAELTGDSLAEGLSGDGLKLEGLGFISVLLAGSRPNEAGKPASV